MDKPAKYQITLLIQPIDARNQTDATKVVKQSKVLTAADIDAMTADQFTEAVQNTFTPAALAYLKRDR